MSPMAAMAVAAIIVSSASTPRLAGSPDGAAIEAIDAAARGAASGTGMEVDLDLGPEQTVQPIDREIGMGSTDVGDISRLVPTTELDERRGPGFEYRPLLGDRDPPLDDRR